MIYNGDNIDILKSLEDNSIDSCVTDPPYGLSFMNKKWDHDVPSVEFWREVWRVLKPGGHVLSFGGTRTYHRMTVNIEDAGFEIRDQVMWLYGSGFPKSHNISKAIDKKFGAERTEKVWADAYHDGGSRKESESKGYEPGTNKSTMGNGNFKTLPASDLAKQWDGFGTALKPSNEPICLARKPLSEKTIVANVLKWGTGGINIDGCRVGTEQVESGRGGRSKTDSVYADGLAPQNERNYVQGRFPANIILDDVAGEMLDAQSGVLKGLGQHKQNASSIYGGKFEKSKSENLDRSEQGGASRFFYCAKASKSERNAGLEGMPEVSEGIGDDRPSGQSMQRLDGRDARKMQNHHPTVKPIKLMRYLTRLITPPGGTCLDPFMGSGTTGLACKEEGFEFIGIELDKEYFEIAERRNTRHPTG